MGCIASKQSVSVTPAFDYSSGLRLGDGGDVLSFSPSTHRSYTSELGKTQGSKKKKKSSRSRSGGGGSELGLSTREGGYKGGVVDFSVSTRLGNLNKYVEGEQVAAGWPAWLSAVAGEAIQGWIPLRADSFEKLEKIGQGTYSSVFRARDLDNGKIVALKKVRFDNFEPESVRFMAREIMILRRLNHPNIVKLEGLITSRLSCSIYLVFEYMEHDISGLSSCPDIKFSESQVKCYMRQLLSGLEHCHSRGIMHRDIKGSNLLVSNDGILKIADFGLANYINPGNRQPLTSRVVTLWYRPPELLLGSTEYGETVDLWSVGCVFAELFLGKPILQGRTEVEQLHKIFKLCGSPPDEYWKKCKLPHATIFKPQNPYDRSLPVVCKDLPKTALNLIETFLFVEASKRGTAASALVSEYFTTKPYACDPSSLPKYPPNKEIDAKSREEARRKKNGGKTRGNEASRRPAKVNKAFREPNGFSKSVSVLMDFQVDNQFAHKSKGDVGHLPKDNVCLPKPDTDTRRNREPLKKPSISTKLESSPTRKAPQEDVPFSGPLQVSTSSGFAWAKRRKEDSAFIRSHSRSSSRNQLSSTIDPFGVLLAKNSCEAKCQGNGEELHGRRTDSESRDSYEMAKLAIRKQWNDFDRAGSFDASEGYHSQEISATAYRKEELGLKGFNLDEEGKVEFSGPLLSQSHRVDELLERNEHHIRQAVRRSWFQKGKKDTT